MMATACALEGGWCGLGLDVTTLHGERIVLIAVVAAADGGEETDHGDDGVGAPCTRGVRRGAGWVTAPTVWTSSPRRA